MGKELGRQSMCLYHEKGITQSRQRTGDGSINGRKTNLLDLMNTTTCSGNERNLAGSFSCLSMREDSQLEMFISGCFGHSECAKKAWRCRGLGWGTEKNPQWLINLGQAQVELRRRGPRLCKMCQKNPAEFSGYCGECYNKLKESKKTPARKRWLLALSHFFE